MFRPRPPIFLDWMRSIRFRWTLGPEKCDCWLNSSRRHFPAVGLNLRRTTTQLSGKAARAANEALLTAYADDNSFYDAMISIGAVPGNNLTMAAWNDRKDKNSTAPDARVKGTPVRVFVWWPDLPSPLPLQDLFVDSGGHGIDMRFGGNQTLIPEWHSGCIACLYSCPGGKVSNHAYTIRDYVREPANFSVNYSKVPKKRHKSCGDFQASERRDA